MYVKDARGCISSLANVVLNAAACNLASRPTATKQTLASSAKLSIKVFPNPSTEQFSMIAEGAKNQKIEVIVTDMLGRKILHTTTAANDRLTFGKEMKAGTYIIEALQGKEKATIKIVKGN